MQLGMGPAALHLREQNIRNGGRWQLARIYETSQGAVRPSRIVLTPHYATPLGDLWALFTRDRTISGVWPADDVSWWSRCAMGQQSFRIARQRSALGSEAGRRTVSRPREQELTPRRFAPRALTSIKRLREFAWHYMVIADRSPSRSPRLLRSVDC